MTIRLTQYRRGILFLIGAGIFLAFLAIALKPWPVLGQRETLYWGSSGSDVRLCQSKLSQWGYYKGSVDGVYGSETARAVREFQRKNGLTVDGVVGPETWAALGYSTARAAAPVTPVSTAGVSQGDNVELLARLISAEARGEPYIGQVAVGAVLLNRLESPSFPNTLAGVIYQPGAFESVSNGQINLAPTAEARRAANDALSGWDPTYGCLYFYNPAKTSNAFIWSRKIVIKIGKHNFAI